MAGFVTVACKMPNGLHLDIEKEEEIQEPVMGGGFRTSKINRKTGHRITLKGPAVPFGEIPSVRVVAGYALNENIDADFWQTWVTQKKDTAIVKERIVFAMPKIDSTADKAKTENRDVKTGLERIDPKNLPKIGNKAIEFGKADSKSE